MAAHNPRKIILPVVLVAAVASAWYYGPWRARAEPGVIRVSGTIEATEILVAPKIAGRMVALKVDEGSVVRRGDLLARLDTRELEAQVGQASGAAAAAQARLQAAVNGSRPEQIAQARAQLAAAQAAVAGANQAVVNARTGFRKVTDLKAQEDAARAKFDASAAALQQAQEALRLVKQGPRQQQVEQARAAVAQADAALKKAENDLQRTQALLRDGAVSAQQGDAAVTARDVARTQLEQARAHLADLVAGARPEEVGQAEMAVSQAKANLEGARLALRNAREAYRDRLAAKTQYDAALATRQASAAQERAARAQLDLLLAGTRPEDVRAAQAQLKQAEEAHRLAGAQMGNAFVYAPVSGVVKTKTAELGEVLSPGAPILTLADIDHPWLRVYVPEDQYGRVRIGQPAEVRIDSYPGQTFAGRVVEIASDAEFTPKNVQTDQERVKLVFGVKIALDNRDGRLKPGMPADAVLRVPVSGR